VGRAAAVLTTRRIAALAALGLGLGVYYAWSSYLWRAGDPLDVAFIALVLIPAVFALVWLALPLANARGLLPVGLAFVLLAWARHEAGADALADFAKLAAATALGFWIVGAIDSVLWVTAVALAVPFIDAYSVWRGPTSDIVGEHPEVFTTLSFAFPIPGETSAARLGPPDLLFFALFLGSAVRFRLRPGLTWVCLVASLGVTLALAFAFEVGLPALPGLSLAFLLPNVDLLWGRWRSARREREQTGEASREPPPPPPVEQSSRAPRSQDEGGR
jgi:hypothetical protein